MKKYFVLALIFLLAGCAFFTDVAPKATTSEDVTHLKEAMNTPLIFSVPKNKSDEIWGRINVFISKYASTKIQTSSDFVVKVYGPSDILHFGYSARRMLKGDEVEFTVNCFSGGLFGGTKNIPAQNAHLLAYYALTGKILPWLIVNNF